MKIFKSILSFIKENLFFILIVTILFVVNFVKVPYDVEMPGGTIDLTDRVTVDGKKVEMKGTFEMAYVGMAQGSIPYVLVGLINPDWGVVKQEDNVYDGESIEDANKRNRLYLEQSKNAALVSALEEAKIDYKIKNKIHSVLYIDTKAKTNLKVGDHILKVQNKKINDVSEIVEIIKKSKIGDKLKVVALRDNKEVNCYSQVIKLDKEAKLGIISMTTLDLETDKKIDISTKESESGPSGGLMMSLMIYNTLLDKDLSNGKKIVGTGTIDTMGNVGEIGGVKYKVMGAVKENADIFFVPKDNYKEAIEVKKEKGYNLDIVKVNTLKEAIEYLEGGN